MAILKGCDGGKWVDVITVRTSTDKKKEIFSTLRALAFIKISAPEIKDCPIPGDHFLCQYTGWREESYFKERYGMAPNAILILRRYDLIMLH